MRQYRRGNTTRTVFEHPYESVRWTADQNWKWAYNKQGYETAERLYREAAELARTDEERQDCIRRAHLARREAKP